MPVIIASSVKEAKALINGGKYREIILNFDIDADDFFSLASSPAIPPELKSPSPTATIALR